MLHCGKQEEVEMAMDDHSYEYTWYLDTLEEEVLFYCNPDITGEYEAMEKLEQQVENDDEGRFIPIPERPSHEGWNQMEQFILSLDDQDEKVRDLLLTTIQGSGAFRRFKDAIYNIGVQDRWFEFKNREDRKEALDWLRSLDLISDEDVEKGLQLYEETLRKRKEQKEEIANMTRGTRVKCRTTSSHEDKLTAGKTYEVLDEQKQHGNIRIRDDRGKTVWLPKSFFEIC